MISTCFWRTTAKTGLTFSCLLRHFDGGLKRAWEERDGPMVFTASVCDRNSAVFDGQGDHVGEHLTYRRTADRLRVPKPRERRVHRDLVDLREAQAEHHVTELLEIVRRQGVLVTGEQVLHERATGGEDLP